MTHDLGFPSNMSDFLTIRDLALKLNVGKSTIHRALTGRPGVSPELRKLILEQATKMGYKPDPLFSAFASRKRQNRSRMVSIAFVYRSSVRGGVDYYLIPAMKRGLELGYQVEEIDLEYFKGSHRFMEILLIQGFLGVIIGGLRSEDHSAILANKLLPVVCCGQIDFLPLHTVQPAITENVRHCWKKVFELGYRRIGAGIGIHLPPMEDDSSRLGAILGCQEEMLEPKDRIPPYLSLNVDPVAFLKWFQIYQPEAVIGFSPSQYFDLKDAGVDLSRIGFASLHREYVPDYKDSIAGLVEPSEIIGYESMNLLDQLIRHRSVGVPVKPLKIHVPSDWLDGESLPVRDNSIEDRVGVDRRF